MSDETIHINATPISAWRYVNPLTSVNNLLSYRDLILQFTIREIQGRYKGTYLGIIWAFIQPLLLLVVYTFVFTVVFKAKWGVIANESRAEYALTIFCGMVIYGIFSECVARAPSLILANPNYVKKVIFPLEILPLSVLGLSLFNGAIGLLIYQIGALLLLFRIPLSLLYVPLILLPLVMLSLGLSWFLSALGVFIRDIGQTINIIITVLFFMSPIFYPLSRVPEQFHIVMRLNPLTNIIEDAHRTIIWGQPPDWLWWGITLIISYLVMQMGYVWFMKSKRAFADVI